MTADVDPLDLVDPERYARGGYPHDVWTRLRAEAPVAYFAPEGLRAVLGDHEARRHPRDLEAAAALLERAGDHAAPRRCGVPAVGDGRDARSAAARSRAPRREQALHAACGPRGQRADIERIAVEILDDAAPAGASAELDFVERIAAPFPLGVIAWVLGVPSDDWELLFRWTNEVIGKDDPEYRRPGRDPGRRRASARAASCTPTSRHLIDERRARTRRTTW